MFSRKEDDDESTDEETLCTALDATCNAAYALAVDNGRVCASLSPQWIDLDGVKAVAVRSVQLLTVLFHYLDLPLLAVVTGGAWQLPVERATPKISFPPHKTAAEAISAFMAGTAATGIILNLSPLSILLLFRESDEVTCLIVATGCKMPPSSVGLPPTVHVSISCGTETAFISGGVCSAEGLQRCTLIGTAIIACAKGETRGSVLATVQSWASSLRVIGKIQLATAPDQEKQLYDLICATSAASACAANVCFDTAINRACCESFGLFPSELGRRYRFHSEGKVSSVFRLDSALATCSWTLRNRFLQNIGSSVSVARVCMPSSYEGGDSTQVPLLRIKKIQSKKRQVSVVLKTPTGCFLLPLPRHLNLMETLYELRCAHRGLSEQIGALSSQQRELVPVGGLTSAPNMLDDNIIFVNGVPLFSPFSGFNFRVRECLSRAVGLVLTTDIVHLIARYIVGDEVPRVMESIDIAAENIAYLEKTLDEVIPPPNGSRDTIFITAMPAAMSIYSPVLSRCKVHFVDESAHSETVQIEEGDYISQEALPDLDETDLSYLVNQRRLRAQVRLILKVGRVTVHFTHAGKLHQLLKESLSVEQICTVALGCYLDYVVRVQNRTPAECGSPMSPMTLFINGRNPMAFRWREKNTLDAQRVPLHLRLSSTISLRIVSKSLKFALPQDPTLQTLLTTIRHKLAEEISEDVLFTPAVATRRSQYPCMKFLNNYFRLCSSVSSLLPSLLGDIMHQVRHFAGSDGTSFDDELPALQLTESVLPVLSLQSDVECPSWLSSLLNLPENSFSMLCGDVHIELFWFNCADQPLPPPLACLHPRTTSQLDWEVKSPDVKRVWALPVNEDSFGGSMFMLSKSLDLPLRVAYTYHKHLFVVDGASIEPFFYGMAESELKDHDQLQDKTVTALAEQYFEAAATAAVQALLNFDLTAAIASGRDDWPVMHFPSMYRAPFILYDAILPNVRARVFPANVELQKLFSRMDCEYVPRLCQPTVHYYKVVPVGEYNETRVTSVLEDIIAALPDCLGQGLTMRDTALEVSYLATLPLLDLAVYMKLCNCGCHICLGLKTDRLWNCSVGSDVQRVMDAACFSLRQQIFYSAHGKPSSFRKCPVPVALLGASSHLDEGASILRRTLQCIPQIGADYLMTQLFFQSDKPGNFFAFPLVCEFMQPTMGRSSRLHSNEFQFEDLRFHILPSKKRSHE